MKNYFEIKIKKLQNKYIKTFDPILFPKIDLRKKIRQSMSSSGMNSALVFAVYVAVDIDWNAQVKRHFFRSPRSRSGRGGPEA